MGALRDKHNITMFFIAVVILLVAVSAVIYFDRQIDTAIEGFLAKDLSELQERTGVTIQYDALFFDILHRVHLSNVRLGFRHHGSETSVMSADTIVFTYNLVDLITGSDMKRGAVLIDQGVFQLDEESLVSIQDTISYIKEMFPSNDDFLYRIDVKNSSLNYIVNDEYTVSSDFEDIFCVYESDQFSLLSKAPVTGVLSMSGDLKTVGFESDTVFSYSFGTGELALELPELQLALDGAPIDSVSVSLRKSGNELTADVGKHDIQAHLTYSLADRSLVSTAYVQTLAVKDYTSYLDSLRDFSSFDFDHTMLSGSVDFSYALDTGQLTYSADLDMQELDISGINAPVNAEIAFSGDNRTFSVESFMTQIDEFTISAAGSGAFDDLFHPVGTISVYDAQKNIEVANITLRKENGFLYSMISSGYLQDVTIDAATELQDDKLSLKGTLTLNDQDHQLSSTLDFDDLSVDTTIDDGTVTIYTNMTDDGITFVSQVTDYSFEYHTITKQPAKLDMRVLGTIHSVDDWVLNLEQVHLTDIAYGTKLIEFGFNANMTPDAAYLYDIVYRDESTPLYGSGRASYNFTERFDGAIRCSLDMSNDLEKYVIDVQYDTMNITADIHVENGQLERLPIAIGSGDVKGDISVEGALDLFAVKADIAIDNGVVFNNPFSGELNALIDQDSISINNVSGVYKSLHLSNLAMDYDVLTGDISTTGEVSFSLERKEISTGISITSKAEELASVLDLSLADLYAQDLTISLQTFDLAVDEEKKDDLSAVAEYSNGKFTIIGGPDNNFSLAYDIDDGSFNLMLDEDLPVSFSMNGVYRNGRVDAVADDVKFDLPYMNSFDIPLLSFEEGEAYGRINIKGSLDDLEYYGEVLCDSARVRTVFTTGDLEVDNMYVALIGKEIIFAPFYIDSDDTFVETQLSFFVDDILPTGLDLRLKVPTDELVAVSYEFSGIRLAYTGGVAGDMHIFGYLGDLSIEGDLFLDSGTVSQAVNLSESRMGSISTIDLSIHTGKNLKAVFPNVELPIITAAVNEGEFVEVTADLPKKKYSATGNIGLRGGEIVYFQRNFYILNGNINLNINQANIDPKISLQAKIKDFDKNGDKVDIFLILENDSLNDLSPVFSSTPDKSLAEISEILGKNIIPTDIVGSNDISAALAVATIATDVIQQVGLIELDPIEELEISIRNAFNLDLFSIRTQVFQNILLDTLPGEYGTTFSRNPIARYLDNTTVFLGKYITNDMFIQAIIQLSINEGYNTGLFITDDLGVDIEVSYEWDNPMYYLTVSTQPESFAFSELLDSLSIGVSWNFTF